MTDRALVTFGTGDFDRLLGISRPGLQSYADRHGYRLLTRPPTLLTRPPSWHKISVLLNVLEDYDDALWVDCDVVVLDDTADVADELGPDAWHGMTRHQTGEGEVPSCGVWYLRQPMQPVLEAVWRLTRYLHHRWWEQAAVQQLLGYTPDQLPVHHEKPTELFARTHWLGVEWNALAPPGGWLDPATRFAHAAPGHPVDVRAQVMRDLVARVPA